MGIVIVFPYFIRYSLYTHRRIPDKEIRLLDEAVCLLSGQWDAELGFSPGSRFNCSCNGKRNALY
ncbi:hypothetical protein [Candidatus Nitrotoga fabula]|uniref:Uncharacterized protein n=1 Tax=Candidatus Nitrotoga fabula TaxID=2182327 RepID=A0A916FAW4_9PROT|nr:hypothetical protein [Candidatus Nitrotoga fabula]CAE6729731.1 conserved hypothetical protein [Candidatus Nitrotoga fabula]